MNEKRVHLHLSDQNGLFLLFTPHCSSFVDVCAVCHYNGGMEAENVQTYICMERSEPKRRILRSDGALYLAVLAGVLAVIIGANALSSRYQWPRLFVQLTLYVVLLAVMYVIYRCCMLSFRYTLTDRMLSVERLVGKKCKPEESVHLRDVVAICPVAEATAALQAPRGVYTGRRRDTLAVTVCEPKRTFTLLISPTNEFADKLIKQWKRNRNAR